MDFKDYEQLITGYKATNIQLENKIVFLEHKNTSLMNKLTTLSKVIDKIYLQEITEKIDDEVEKLRILIRAILPTSSD